MLNALRYDFYRMFKSKGMWATLIVCLLLTLFMPVFQYCIKEPNVSVIGMVINDDYFISMALVVFCCTFFWGDFSSGFVKNFRRNTTVTSLYRLLSKLICLLTFAVAIELLYLAVNTLLCYVCAYDIVGDYFFCGIPKDSELHFPFTSEWATVEDMIIYICLHVEYMFATGLLSLAAYSIVRSGIVVSIASLAYFMLCENLYLAIEGIFGMKEWTFMNYTVFGNLLDAYYFVHYKYEGIYPDYIIDPHFDVRLGMIGLGYIFVLFFITWLAMKKREVK